MKHLYRSETNRVFAGICGGLGEYTGIDPVLLRLVWTFIVIFTGIFPGLVFYIIAILIVPKESKAKAAHHVHHEEVKTEEKKAD